MIGYRIKERIAILENTLSFVTQKSSSKILCQLLVKEQGISLFIKIIRIMHDNLESLFYLIISQECTSEPCEKKALF